MDKLRRFVGRHGLACLCLSVFAVCALIVFWQALPKFTALVSPDSGPFFVYAHRTSLIERFLGGAAFTPHVLYWMLFPPLYAHELTYILDSLLLTLAGVYYLRGRRVHPVAAWFGGLALGLCGYTFTLFAAGHRGYFHMFSCAAWSFGLLIRCFETKRLFYFAALGLVFAWGATCQPDVLVLVGVVAACYALWLTVKHRSRKPEVGSRKESGGHVWGNVISVWPRFAVSLVFLVLAGFGSLRSSVTTTMASRDAQIAGISAAAQKAAAEAPKVAPSEQERRERWQFATGWSLPPEDVLEFVAPGVFGDESMQMPYPYWGRLGRPAEEAFQKGRMMPNYRGHTVYLGLVSVLFAVLAVVAWAGARKRAKDPSPLQADADYSDVPFWCGVWAVCLVLALGRYTPIYRLFYALPYMDYIRAPVKFHHLVELATAMLAGLGMDAFLRAPAMRRRLALLAGGFALALVLGAGVMLANKSAIVSHIASLGLGQVSPALGSYAVHSLLRSACLAGLIAGLAWWAARQASERMLVRLGCVALAVLALEQAAVAKRYVRVINVAPFYHANAVVSAIKKDASDRFVNVINYVTPNAWAQDWFSTSLSMNGIRNLAPGADERETPFGRLCTALQADPLRLWRLCGVEYVILPRKGSEELVRAGVLQPVLYFELGQGVVRPVAPGESSLLVARVRDVSGKPRLVTGWEGGVPAERQADEVARGRPDVTDAPTPAAPGGVSAPGEVRVLSSRGQPGAFGTRLRVSSKAAGLIIFAERLDDPEILVDGQRVASYVADCCWPAALVPAGEHEVVLRRSRNFKLPLIGGLAACLVFVWGVAGLVRARGKSVTG